MAIEIGDAAPGFRLADQDGRHVSLEALQGRKTLVVFVPFAFTATCEGELCDIRDNLNRLEDLDANVVAITCDTRFTNKRWADDQGFGFPILSDHWPHGETARAYGCFNDALGCAMRTTYVLDGDGVVQDIIATDSLRTPRPVDAYAASLAVLGGAPALD